MANTVKVTKEMLVWTDKQSGMYKTPAGYVLLEYHSGEARWMSARQAKAFIKLSEGVRDGRENISAN